MTEPSQLAADEKGQILEARNAQGLAFGAIPTCLDFPLVGKLARGARGQGMCEPLYRSRLPRCPRAHHARAHPAHRGDRDEHPCFHIGRLEIRLSPEGEFTTIELNGSASEPLHAWDPRNGALQAWHAYFEQIDLLYQLGAANRAAGHPSLGARALLRDWARQHRLMRRYPIRS